MCLGVPMTLVETNGVAARVVRGEDVRVVSLLLVGDVPVGGRVLVHLDAAVRVLDPAEADQLDAALRGLEAAARGEDFSAYFDDLVHREPRLPEHLQEVVT